jgi:hypothetical protein
VFFQVAPQREMKTGKGMHPTAIGLVLKLKPRA